MFSAFQSNAFQRNAYQINGSGMPIPNQNTGGWYSPGYKDRQAEKNERIRQEFEAHHLAEQKAQEDAINLKLEAQAKELRRREAKEVKDALEVTRLEAELAQLQLDIALQAKKMIMIENQKALLVLTLSYPFLNLLTENKFNDNINPSGPQRSGPQGV